MSILLASEAAGFGLNSNIFETNIINIAIVLSVLVYVGRSFIGKILSTRLETITTEISAAEKRKQEAIEQLADQQKNLTQAQAESDRLRQKAEADAKVAGEAILASVASDIERLREAATQEISTEQDRAIIQLRQQVADKALAEVRNYLGRGLSPDVQQQLVDRSIALLSK
jgi:F-type H+-transporting ATPase subunit b